MNIQKNHMSKRITNRWKIEELELRNPLYIIIVHSVIIHIEKKTKYIMIFVPGSCGLKSCSMRYISTPTRSERYEHILSSHCTIVE